MHQQTAISHVCIEKGLIWLLCTIAVLYCSRLLVYTKMVDHMTTGHMTICSPACNVYQDSHQVPELLPAVVGGEDVPLVEVHLPRPHEGTLGVHSRQQKRHYLHHLQRQGQKCHGLG